MENLLENLKSSLEAKERDINIHIFIKKDDDEGKDFYYIGQAYPDQSTAEEAMMKDKKR